ncbi:MAG: oxidoreductase [Eggerthellaceae bacterium]|nr:oxidoreductase [Eggerthellaceae bacterium]
MKAFVFDAARCNGCFNCQIACKDEHVDNDWAPYAAPQPDTGHFWMRVDQKVHGQVPKVRLEYRVSLCNHCADAPCVKAAPDAVHQREDGLVIIDPERARGRHDLVEACPYGAIYLNEELDLPQKCTGCAHLVDAGEQPRCVAMCPTGALRFGDEEDLADALAQGEVSRPELGCGPRVHYLNLPKLFISGDVWDKEANEIIEGAEVRLEAPDGSQLVTQTDDLGDFWFRGLEAGDYVLSVACDGYVGVEARPVALEESLNVGDFPLVRA